MAIKKLADFSRREFIRAAGYLYQFPAIPIHDTEFRSK